jgi:predicted esterase
MYIGLILALMAGSSDFIKQLDLAGDNRLEIEIAILEVPDSQKAGMAWLLTHMPEEDLKILSGDFLLKNCNLAYEAWQNAPWAEQITEEIFFDTILPYANVNERRDDWRGDFHDKFIGIVSGAKTPTEATILLNKNIFNLVNVYYSTKRPKADQSPYESIEAGMASCSGLSILLVDACRSVGIPARFVGTPLWYNESGNHSWVEFWDEGWHYTGGAEPTGDNVDVAWFDGSASKATKGHPQHAIFAVTWNESEQHFPLIWLPEVVTYGAIDVTDRYTEEQTSVLVPIRFRVCGPDGNRQVANVYVQDIDSKKVWEVESKGEVSDANDHVTLMLPRGIKIKASTGSDAITFTTENEIVVDLTIGTLTERGAKKYASELWKEQNHVIEGSVIEYSGKTMPFWHTTYGDAPFGEKSLWISMHGGGGAPEKVNTQQWENQKHLYTLDEGVYVAPRAPTDTWNLWHQAHIDPMFEKLIAYMVIKEGVDPNKVYIVGYSAGGDGVYQLATRMADRFAGAGMMAGHPNETVPVGLRNIAFALHMGGDDSAYDRNKKAEAWKDMLGDLQANDTDGYTHQVVIHEGKGHWMGGQDAAALPWLAQFERNPHPLKIVWAQDDVLHTQFYWLGVDNPKARTTIIASVEGQTITIHESDVKKMTIYLNDEILDLDKPIVLKYKDIKLASQKLQRSRAVIQKTLRDPKDYYTAEFNVELP